MAAALLALAVSCSSTSSEEREPRILLFAKTAAFRHESIGPAVAALRLIAADEGVSVDATEDAASFTPSELARYDAVVFLLTTGDVLDDRQQGALEGFVAHGGGFAGVHSATDTEYGWPWYGELVGARFVRHAPGVHSARLSVRVGNHPATVGLPTPWARMDEWYEFRDLQPGLTVLLDLDETSYKTAAENPAPAPRPIAWSRAFAGGRSFYTALGHTSESWSEPLFLAHVWGGIESVLRGAGG
jgi:type 1 glutamine amidotransferase